MRKYRLLIILFILILLDQVSKLIIIANKNILPIGNSILQVNYQENYGIAFGITFGGRLTYIIANLIIILIISKFLYTHINIMTNTKKLVFILIIAGGVGNLIDRLVRGYVIDYIDFSKIIDFPIFNFADIMIVCGTIFLAIIYIKEEFLESREK